jgi:cytochrome c oxidase subunit 1/cytochrome c oxidase subunit I+III
MFVGMNVAFLPMHITGLWGMPRRVYTYPAGIGWDALNLTTSIGAFLFAIGVVLLLVNVAVSRRRGAVAGPNPWGAGTLEWSVPSPPPPYNFTVIPRVASGYPLWEDQLRESERRSSVAEGLVLDHGREIVATEPLDGDPDLILRMPEDSYAPLMLSAAMAAGFAGLLVHWWWLAGISALVVVAAIVVWLWPERKLGQVAGALDV